MDQQHPDIAAHVSGSAEGGFIVDMHDGQHHHAHISHADDAETAEGEGKREFASLHRRDRRDGDAESQSPPNSEVSAMREEITGLRESVGRLEANVADLLKHREGVKTAADQEHAQEVRELQGRVDKANDAMEHHMDHGDGDHVERDAHGQDVRDPNRVHTAATDTIDERPAGRRDRDPDHSREHIGETDAERNAREAGTEGVENRENPAAADGQATYADKGAQFARDHHD